MQLHAEAGVAGALLIGLFAVGGTIYVMPHAPMTASARQVRKLHHTTICEEKWTAFYPEYLTANNTNIQRKYLAFVSAKQLYKFCHFSQIFGVKFLKLWVNEHTKDSCILRGGIHKSPALRPKCSDMVTCISLAKDTNIYDLGESFLKL